MRKCIRLRQRRSQLHKAFIGKLKAMLPHTCCSIVVTDGGFKLPWLKLITSVGIMLAGSEGERMLRQSDGHYIRNCDPMASTTSRCLGCKEITRSNPLRCHLVLYKGKPKGRHRLNRANERTYCEHSEVHSEREKEPWMLVTSLPVTSTLAKKVVKLYSARMQIEEAFRDIKS